MDENVCNLQVIITCDINAYIVFVILHKLFRNAETSNFTVDLFCGKFLNLIQL